jgi:hypothetical protein
MNELFKEYGDVSLQEAVEALATTFVTKGLNPPVRVVLDKAAYAQFLSEASAKTSTEAQGTDQVSAVASTLTIGNIEIVQAAE